MKKGIKIAIYSGEITSTTFIERLIVGLSNSDCEILLFGIKKKRGSYRSNVSVKGYKNLRFQKGVYLLWYSFLLFFFKNKDKKKLDTLLKSQSRTGPYEKVKTYPVLWHRPDIFHLQWAKGMEDWVWVQDFGMKLVVSLRGAHINYSPLADERLASMYKKYFPKVDGFHAVSKAIALESEKYNAPREKIDVVYSGLNIEEFNNYKVETSSCFEIISVGRPHWKKGYPYALDACKILKGKGLKFKYTIIGGENDLELVYQMHDLNLQNEVVLKGQMPFDEVQQFIKNANLFLLPSVEEGIANVVLESMAIGTIVLTTDCGGMEEVITNGENGFLVPLRDSIKMADKIEEISNISIDRQTQMKHEALNTIKNQHTNEQMINGMIKLYNSLY